MLEGLAANPERVVIDTTPVSPRASAVFGPEELEEHLAAISRRVAAECPRNQRGCIAELLRSLGEKP